MDAPPSGELRPSMSGSVSTAVTCGQHCGTGPGSETQLADLSVCVCVCVCVCECVCVCASVCVWREREIL